MTPSSSQQLNIGNVVSAGFRLYRNHLKSYFLLALKAYCWVLIPVYGWAKYYTISATIARLSFGELVNQPETIDSASRHTNSKLWQFLLTLLLQGLIFIGIYIVYGVLIGLVVAIVAGLSQILQNSNIILIAIATITALFAVIAFTVGIFWIGIRFFIADVPLAVEDGIDASATISRSWNLTKYHVWRIMAIAFIAALITLPLIIIVQVISSVLQLLFISLIEQNSAYTGILIILTIALSFVSGAVQLPFWQAIKAVIYYDLRTRKEGLGLKLRDREI